MKDLVNEIDAALMRTIDNLNLSEKYKPFCAICKKEIESFEAEINFCENSYIAIVKCCGEEEIVEGDISVSYFLDDYIFNPISKRSVKNVKSQ
jgi:hypothetical protein